MAESRPNQRTLVTPTLGPGILYDPTIFSGAMVEGPSVAVDTAEQIAVRSAQIVG